jgi:hypothetical protein
MVKMTNNAPDYKDNLAFPPQEIKSQDDLNTQGRKSDVLIKALDKCQKLEMKLDLAVKGLLGIGSWLVCDPKDLEDVMPNLCVGQECLDIVNSTLEEMREIDNG